MGKALLPPPYCTEEREDGLDIPEGDEGGLVLPSTSMALAASASASPSSASERMTPQAHSGEEKGSLKPHHFEGSDSLTPLTGETRDKLITSCTLPGPRGTRFALQTERQGSEIHRRREERYTLATAKVQHTPTNRNTHD